MRVLVAGVALLCAVSSLFAGENGVFFNETTRAAVQKNIATYPWAKAFRDKAVKDVEPWMKLTHDELWEMIFTPEIPRSWMVWSSGFCPACKQPVRMYRWKIAGFAKPWKVQCPSCNEFFPKNDFAAYYKSGLDEHGDFDFDRADRKLLFNVEHPDPADPLHLFGVDDGRGYVEGENRWRFIGAFLIYGQWKQKIITGIERLALAHAVTGDPEYARRAIILLNRVADHYPDYNGKQLWVYEKSGDNAYVSAWHDASAETRVMALAYDVVRAAADDPAVLAFLGGKTERFRLPHPVRTAADLRDNIETRILKDAVKERLGKIKTNYPQQDVTVATAMMVLDWPNNRDEVMAFLDPMFKTATAVDGTTGEKGVGCYTLHGVAATASWMMTLMRVDERLYVDLLERHPRMQDGFRFFHDIWCLGKYYPNVGDSYSYKHVVPFLIGIGCPDAAKLPQSLSTLTSASGGSFLYDLYRRTGNRAYLRMIPADALSRGFPADFTEPDPVTMADELTRLTAEAEGHFEDAAPGSLNKTEWGLALMRSGAGADARAAWMAYSSVGNHTHDDFLNIGLFTRDMDVFQDLGYPPVQFGGWWSAAATWYIGPASHNMVIVDDKRVRFVRGDSTWWEDRAPFQAIRVAIQAREELGPHERVYALVDIDDSRFYVLDLFRAEGGKKHTRLFHTADYPVQTDLVFDRELRSQNTWNDMLRNQKAAAFRSEPGWDYAFTIPNQEDFVVRDLTAGFEPARGDGMLATGAGFSGEQRFDLPIFMNNRYAEDDEPLKSLFVSVMGWRDAGVEKAYRLSLPEPLVAVGIPLSDGGEDRVIYRETNEPLTIAEWNVETDAKLAWWRVDADGKLVDCRFVDGTHVTVDGVTRRP